MGKLASVLAVLAVWHAVAGRPAAATVNVTGRWFFDAGSLPTTKTVDLEQTGSTLVARDGATMALLLSGTIDSTSGAFTLAGPSLSGCQDTTLDGVVAPDGNTLTAMERDYVRLLPGCVLFSSSIHGRRVQVGCGDGLVQGAEQCDDANFDPGDGCDASCHQELCFECIGSPSSCRGPVAGCAVFASNCHAASASRKVTLSMKTSTQPGHARVSWKWSGSDPDAPGDFGSPDLGVGVYAFGIFDRSTPTPAPIAGAVTSICSSLKPCWKRKSTGFDYRRSDGSPQGLVRIKLKAGPTGEARVQVTGKGAGLVVPSLPLASPVALTVQVRAPSGVCWETRYDPAGVVTNEPGKLKAR